MNFSCSLLLRKSFITDVLQGTYATMDNHLPDFLRNASTVYVYAQFDRDLLKGCQIFWSFLMKYFWSKSEKWIYSNKGTSKFGTTVPFLSYRKFVNSTQFTLMKLWLLMQLAFYSKKVKITKFLLRLILLNCQRWFDRKLESVFATSQ